MAKYSVTHVCGHEETVTLFGLGKDRDKRIQWMETLFCSTCASSRRITDAAPLHDLQVAGGLPRLVGSDKQVAWAVQLRADFCQAYRKIEEKLTTAALSNEPHAKLAEELLFELDAFASAPLAATEAKYWIDNRANLDSGSIDAHLYRIRMDLAARAKALMPEANPVGLSDTDKREIVQMALDARREALDARREETRNAASQRILDAQKAETERQRKIWEKKDAVAQMILAASSNALVGARLAIWTKGPEKRVYLEGGKSKFTLYVTGNSRNRPGTLEVANVRPSYDLDLIKSAMGKFAAQWTNCTITLASTDNKVSPDSKCSVSGKE
jgi:hypothetical protein